MRGLVLGGLLGFAVLVVGVVGLADAQSPRTVSNERAGQDRAAGSADLLALSHEGPDGRQQVTIVDSKQRVMAVYTIDRTSGAIALKSVRNLQWDLMIEDYNSGTPAPRDIRALKRTTTVNRMAGKFVDMTEAAKMLGVSAESLIEMRSKGAIFGYRDGASWKFKVDEVERVIRERGVEARDDSGIFGADDDEFDNMISGLSSKILADKAQEEAEPGPVLISEEELGASATGKSTIIGKADLDRNPSDSDLRLADDDILGGGSDKLIEAPGDKIDLAGASDVLHGSDIHVTSGSGTGVMPALKKGGSGELSVDDDLILGEDEDSSDSVLEDEIGPKTGTGSSGKGSDVTMGAGDSGINLKPSDSGISLEDQPLDLGGGSGLDIADDEQVVALGGEAADQEVGTQVKADNEFLLSASDSLDDEDSDSGSQVIALEDSESFDQDAATMLKTDEGAFGAEAFEPVGDDGGLVGAGPAVGGQPMYVQVARAETPYSVWNVLALGTVAGMLALSGMMMVDVMLNMWSFSGTSSLSTGLMDVFVSMFGM